MTTSDAEKCRIFGSIADIIIIYALMDCSEDSITAKYYDPDGNGGYGPGYYVRVSKIKALHHGLSRPQMRGKTDYDFLSQEEANKARKVDIEVMKTRKQHTVTEEKIVREGKTIYYTTTVIPLINPDNVVLGTLCIARDITKRVEAQLKAARLNRFLIRRIYNPLAAIMPIINNSPMCQTNIGRILNEIFARIHRLLKTLA